MVQRQAEEVDEPAGVFCQTFLLVPGGDTSGGGGGRVFDSDDASLGRVAEAMLAGEGGTQFGDVAAVGPPVVAAVGDGVPVVFLVGGTERGGKREVFGRAGKG